MLCAVTALDFAPTVLTLPVTVASRFRRAATAARPRKTDGHCAAPLA